MYRNTRFYIWLVFFVAVFALNACTKGFLSAYKYNETGSGLKYHVISKGKGISPNKGDIVSIHYSGEYEDGTVFDKSRDRNNPVSFRLGSGLFLQGLEEGITFMNVGAKYRFVIPPELAYGNEQVGVINPNSTLIYEVELLDVKKGVKIKEVEKDEVEKIVTESGLVYSILKEGDGPKAFPGMMVVAEYTGFFDDNVIFDSSKENGEPLKAKLGDETLIKGLEEGFTYLSEGDHARLWIPSELAYGEEGRGIIPPDKDLVFDVELIKVDEPKKPVPFNVEGKDTLETESGLKYIVVNQGYGKSPEPGQIVKVHYSAYLENGYMFDSSVQRSQPLKIVAGKGLLIKGWDEAVLLMRKNAKYRFIMPHDLAFGEKGFGDVPPYSTVIYDIELIDIE
ncbi:MAG: FKBP-type peptidyl-prolyl cis-trans isomerase [Bacteroidales bacterium]